MKNTLKRTMALFIAVMMVFCLTACGGEETASNSSVVVGNSSVESTDTVTSEDVVNSSESSQPEESSSAPTNSQASTNQSTSSQRPSVSTPSTTTSTPDNSNNVNYEKPYEGNSAILAGGQTSKYDSQAETLRKNIVNTKDKGFKGTATYYISYKGNDNNTGTSKDQAWKSITKLNTMISSIPEGAVVLFERGGVYRGKLFLRKGITLAAYGTGYKPAIYGSSKNYGKESLWKKTSTKNVWVANTSAEGGDVGLVVFDHGKKTTTKRLRLEQLKKDYDMLSAAGQVYVYLSEGNPGKLHKDIEMCGTSGNAHIITGNVGIKNVTIDNLCIKYGGIHGIQFSSAQNVTITNCEVGYIGGATGSAWGGAWLGNGIELWESCKDVLVDNCWVYQCFDAGITNQGKACVQENITFSNNLVEYCAYNIEYFVNQDATGKMKNIIYSDNILRFAGYGCFDPTNRQGTTGEDDAISLICGWGVSSRTYDSTNFVIKNNILDTSYRYIVSITEPNTNRNATITGNTYYQKKSAMASICIANKNTEIRATSDSQFKEEVAKFDAKAKAAELVG